MSLSNKNKIPFAFSKKLNRVVGVDEVERGLKCGCICIGCGMELKSRHGEEREHHFAHHEDADEACSYSYWVSIRDLVKQLLRESKHIQCSNSPKEEASTIGEFYKLELSGEEVLREKYGVDIIFSSSIGSVGIYFLTDEKKAAPEVTRDKMHHILEIDLRPIQDNQICTVDILRDMIMFEPVLKRFIFKSLAQEQDYKYGRLYRAKSIMDRHAYKAMGIAPTAINSFERSDFSAINVAKPYYLKMLELFKHNKYQEECAELNVDRVHRFFQFRDQYYAVAIVRDKYYLYQISDDELVLVGTCFKEDDIPYIIKTVYTETRDKNQDVQKKELPTLFDL